MRPAQRPGGLRGRDGHDGVGVGVSVGAAPAAAAIAAAPVLGAPPTSAPAAAPSAALLGMTSAPAVNVGTAPISDSIASWNAYASAQSTAVGAGGVEEEDMEAAVGDAYSRRQSCPRCSRQVSSDYFGPCPRATCQFQFVRHTPSFADARAWLLQQAAAINEQYNCSTLVAFTDVRRGQVARDLVRGTLRHHVAGSGRMINFWTPTRIQEYIDYARDTLAPVEYGGPLLQTYKLEEKRARSAAASTNDGGRVVGASGVVDAYAGVNDASHTCPTCSSSFKSLRALYQHMASQSPEHWPTKASLGRGPLRGEFQCQWPGCNYIFPSKHWKKRHVKDRGHGQMDLYRAQQAGTVPMAPTSAAAAAAALSTSAAAAATVSGMLNMPVTGGAGEDLAAVRRATPASARAPGPRGKRFKGSG